MADTTVLTAGAAAVLMLAIGAAATGMVGPSRTDLGAGLILAQGAPAANARDLPANDPDIAPALPPQPADRGTLTGRNADLRIDANKTVPGRPEEAVPLPLDPAQPAPPIQAQQPPRPVVVEPDPVVKNPPVKPQPLPTPVPPPPTKDPVTVAPTKPPTTTTTPSATATSGATHTASATKTSTARR